MITDSALQWGKTRLQLIVTAKDTVDYSPVLLNRAQEMPKRSDMLQSLSPSGLNVSACARSLPGASNNNEKNQ
ncbi:hypothetical protein [Vibrio sp. 10N]|uniref:hypothetical protein n=1 Tax=Vibrio sp. 10N TaxID=3058938 RepID=UPI0028146E4B|nr:hypothetical protein VB10N_31710 [Vibrio sp. 10N]